MFNYDHCCCPIENALLIFNYRYIEIIKAHKKPVISYNPVSKSVPFQTGVNLAMICNLTKCQIPFEYHIFLKISKLHINSRKHKFELPSRAHEDHKFFVLSKSTELLKIYSKYTNGIYFVLQVHH